MRNASILIQAILMILFLTVSAHAGDNAAQRQVTVYLKNGNVLKGTITGATATTTTVKTVFGVLNVNNSDIESIRYPGAPAVQPGPNAVPRYAGPPPPTQEQVTLAQRYWAQRKVDYLTSSGTVNYVIGGLLGASAVTMLILGISYNDPITTGLGIFPLGFSALSFYSGYTDFAMADRIRLQYHLASAGSLMGYDVDADRLSMSMPSISMDGGQPEEQAGRQVRLSLLTVTW